MTAAIRSLCGLNGDKEHERKAVVSEVESMKLDLEEMVKLYKDNPTDEQLNDIIVAMEPLIKYWCQAQCYLAWEKEDLMQVARMAVVGALERFEPAKGIRFKTFAYRTVSGKIMNYFRDSTWRVTIPRKYRELSTYINKAEAEFYKTHGESPTTEQIAQMLGIGSKQVEEALEAIRATQTASLSETEDNENSGSLLNIMGTTDGNLDKVELKKDLQEAMQLLSEIQRKVIYYRYFEDLTQNKTAEILHMSQIQISRLERSALQKIRLKMLVKE